MGNEWLINLFNTVDIRVVDSVCKNIGYELIIKDGLVVGFNVIE